MKKPISKNYTGFHTSLYIPVGNRTLKESNQPQSRAWKPHGICWPDFGRSSRLGERTRGILDAGATSCNIILQAIADSIKKLLV